MASKAERLKRHAVASARRPKPARLVEDDGPRKRGYKVVAISLYTDQAEAVDRTTRELQRAGYPKANRSFVIQAAIRHLHDELEGKSTEEIRRYFTEQEEKRARAS